MSLLTTVSPIVLLVAGFVVCFLGYRLLRLTLGLAGFGVGLALGLAIAKRMVELMGGSINVKIDKDGGSSFNFSFRCNLHGTTELL